MSSSVSNENLVSINPSTPQAILPTESLKKWELGVSLVLHNWSVLADAVVAQWGGPDSDDKRDWLCGAIADMFTEREETDEYDIESVLVQVMGDEFQVNLEDDSAWGIAQRLVFLRKEVLEGNFSTVDELHAKFLAKPKNQHLGVPQVTEVTEEAGSSEDEGDSDEEMLEAPSTGPSETRRRVEPVLDEDGFELVQKRGRK